MQNVSAEQFSSNNEGAIRLEVGQPKWVNGQVFCLTDCGLIARHVHPAPHKFEGVLVDGHSGNGVAIDPEKVGSLPWTELPWGGVSNATSTKMKDFWYLGDPSK